MLDSEVIGQWPLIGGELIRHKHESPTMSNFTDRAQYSGQAKIVNNVRIAVLKPVEAPLLCLKPIHRITIEPVLRSFEVILNRSEAEYVASRKVNRPAPERKQY